MLTLEMLPARHGDCLWIEYGSGTARHRILIDGGTAPTYHVLRERIMTLKARGEETRFELLVVSNVDGDHIEGAVRLLGDTTLDVRFDDIWFNGWRHLSDTLGPKQGEFLAAEIEDQGRPWNAAFGGRAVLFDPGAPLPARTLAGGLKLTVLSPTREELRRLRPVWERAVLEAGLTPGDTDAALAALERDRRLRPADALGETLPPVSSLASRPFEEDTAAANGSSIALLAEFEGKRFLLAADAHPRVLTLAIDQLLAAESRHSLPLDLYKLSHHGSKGNNSPTLFGRVECRRYLFSTNGSLFHHPDQETVARILMKAGDRRELSFNYRTPENEVWDVERLKRRYDYETVYPAAGESGLNVSV